MLSSSHQHEVIGMDILLGQPFKLLVYRMLVGCFRYFPASSARDKWKLILLAANANNAKIFAFWKHSWLTLNICSFACVKLFVTCSAVNSTGEFWKPMCYTRWCTLVTVQCTVLDLDCQQNILRDILVCCKDIFSTCYTEAFTMASAVTWFFFLFIFCDNITFTLSFRS